MPCIPGCDLTPQNLNHVNNFLTWSYKFETDFFSCQEFYLRFFAAMSCSQEKNYITSFSDFYDLFWELKPTKQNKITVSHYAARDQFFFPFSEDLKRCKFFDLGTQDMQSIIMFADYFQMTRLHHLMAKVLADKLRMELNDCDVS